MRNHHLALLGAAVNAGCFCIVPRTVAWTDVAEVESDGTPDEGTLELAVRPAGGDVSVVAIVRRACVHERVKTVTRHRKTSAKFQIYFPSCDEDEDCGELAALGILLAPVTLLVSGVYTAAVSGGDETEQTTEVLPPARRRCDAPAVGLKLRVVAPDRPEATAVTDAAGRARVALGSPEAVASATVYVDEPAGVAPVEVKPSLGMRAE